MQALHDAGGSHAAADEALPVALRPLALVLRTVPDGFHEWVLAQAASGVLSGGGERLRALEGRRVELVVTDTGTRMRLRVQGGRVRRDPAPGAGAYDVAIRGRLLDFLRLAAGTADPDTLFFARRLSLEGDTAMGLQIKNLLDALELDWREPLRRALGASAGARAVAWIERSGVEPTLRGLVERILR